jgi:hypothetical protein
MTPSAIANSEALGMTCRRGSGKASHCHDRCLEPDVFHVPNSTILLLMSGDSQTEAVTLVVRLSYAAANCRTAVIARITPAGKSTAECLVTVPLKYNGGHPHRERV